MSYLITIYDDANNQYSNKHINENGYDNYKDANADWHKVVKDVKNNLKDFAIREELHIELHEFDDDGDLIPISNPTSPHFGEWQLEIVYP